MTGDGPLATSRWEQARRRATQLRHFYVHVLAFAVGNTTAFVVNWMTLGDGSHSWWFQWGLVVWATALAVHGLTVVGRARWLGPEVAVDLPLLPLRAGDPRSVTPRVGSR